MQKPVRTSFADFKRIQVELKRKAIEASDKQIGPFNFEYDDDIESEVLFSDQVYSDLKELDEILGRSKKAKGT